MEIENPEVKRHFAKYIFLDVVGFSKRSAEAQSDIVNYLNEIVRQALGKYSVRKDEDCIFIPTGDGMCIAFISQDLQYDIHMQMSLSILESLDTHNKEMTNATRQFQIRIGINQNTDIIVIDINERKNVAGAGINMAARIMDQADGNQILVSRTVFDELQPSEIYEDKFRAYNAEGKHKLIFTVYQYKGDGHVGLNINEPNAFAIAPKKGGIQLDKLVACYFAHAIRNKAFILQRASSGVDAVYMSALLYSLAKDSVGVSEATEYRPYIPKTDGWGKLNFENQLLKFKSFDTEIISELCYLISDKLLIDYSSYMKSAMSAHAYIFVLTEGIEKLRNEWPDIWKTFELDKYV